MITKTELEWIVQAAQALEYSECSEMSQHRLLKTISSIADQVTNRIEDNFNNRIQRSVAKQHLFDTLSQKA